MPKPLKIAFLVDRFGRRFGGAEAYSVDLVEKLVSRGHQVTVIAHDFDHHLPIETIKILGPRWWPSWLRVWHFAHRASTLTQKGFDIVHSNMDGPAGQIQVMHVSPVRFRRLQGRSKWSRYLVWCSPRNLIYFWLEGARMRPLPGHQVVAVAPVIKDQVLSAYGDWTHVDVIPPGVNPATRDDAARERIRESLRIRDTDIVCLLVALNPLRKGLRPLMQAVALLPEHYKILVVGADQELTQTLAQEDLTRSGRLLLISPTTAISAYYSAADICVHPTLGDSFAMAPLEAMAHGLPVVVSQARFCGFAQYVTHRVDALVLEQPDNPQEIRSAIQSLIENPGLRQNLLTNSKRLVDQLSWDRVADEYEALYREALTSARA